MTEPGGTELSAAVRGALSSSEQRVVGVVVNAIDDHLRGPDQVRPEWTLGYFSPQISALLDEAEAAGRVVIFTSDHGHVLDANTELRPSEPLARSSAGEGKGEGAVFGDRWRITDGEPGPEELVVTGDRLDPGVGKSITSPLE